jgi:hypothetical protein
MAHNGSVDGGGGVAEGTLWVALDTRKKVRRTRADDDGPHKQRETLASGHFHVGI